MTEPHPTPAHLRPPLDLAPIRARVDDPVAYRADADVLGELRWDPIEDDMQALIAEVERLREYLHDMDEEYRPPGGEPLRGIEP